MGFNFLVISSSSSLHIQHGDGSQVLINTEEP